MIQSPIVKWFVVSALLGVAAYFVVASKPSRRFMAYALGGVFAAPAVYVLVRVHPRKAPPSTRGSLLGDVDSFLPKVPELALRFREWAKPRGLSESAEPYQFLEWLWRHREAIGAQWETMLPMAAAAYGEFIRSKDRRTVWTIRGGDAVVEVPGRPWTRTRVAIEVHDTVFLDV